MAEVPGLFVGFAETAAESPLDMEDTGLAGFSGVFVGGVVLEFSVAEALLAGWLAAGNASWDMRERSGAAAE